MQDVALLLSHRHLPSLSPGLLPAQAPFLLHPRDCHIRGHYLLILCK